MRSTLYRNAPGGHFPDCIPGVVCHCPVNTLEPRRLIRAVHVRRPATEAPAVAKP